MIEIEPLELGIPGRIGDRREHARGRSPADMRVAEGHHVTRRRGEIHQPAAGVGDREPRETVFAATGRISVRAEVEDRQRVSVGVSNRFVELSFRSVLVEIPVQPRVGVID